MATFKAMALEHHTCSLKGGCLVVEGNRCASKHIGIVN